MATRNNPKTLSPALVTDTYDFNRDGFVNATDQILARSNSTTLAASLKLISPPASVGSLSAAAAQPSTIAAMSASPSSTLPVRQPQADSASVQRATAVDAILSRLEWSEASLAADSQLPVEGHAHRFASARRIVQRPAFDQLFTAADEIDDFLP